MSWDNTAPIFPVSSVQEVAVIQEVTAAMRTLRWGLQDDLEHFGPGNDPGLSVDFGLKRDQGDPSGRVAESALQELRLTI